MLPIYTSTIFRQWDEYTIKHEPISSIDLMEKAAKACVEWLINNCSTKAPISIVCGNGNNGGDGFAIARLLLHYSYSVSVYCFEKHKKSSDCQINFEKLIDLGFTNFKWIKPAEPFDFKNSKIIVDCMFGTGLDRPLENSWQTLVQKINDSGLKIISIDLPSGLRADPNSDTEMNWASIVKSHYTLTFETPKLSMLLSDFGNYCGQVEILKIGLTSDFIAHNPSDLNFITAYDIQKRFKLREKFSHKGTFGHALIIAGEHGQLGAGILCSKACMKSGAGLVSALTKAESSAVFTIAIPEVMTIQDDYQILNLDKFSAIGIGPGMGLDLEAETLLKWMLEHTKSPMLLDADAITLLSKNLSTFHLPENCILTPHPKEFDRLAGPSNNAYDRLLKAQKFAIDQQCILVLKGAYTAICSPDGKVFFNSTGNAGLATAGSGDVLTGIITAFLAQGYMPLDAAIVGVFIHGQAGDVAATEKSKTSLIASDIIDALSKVFKIVEAFDKN